MRYVFIFSIIFLSHALFKSLFSVCSYLFELPNKDVFLLSKITFGIIVLALLITCIWSFFSSWKRSSDRNEAYISLYLLRFLSLIFPVVLFVSIFVLRAYFLPIVMIFIFLTFITFVVSKVPRGLKEKNRILQFIWFFLFASLILYLEICIMTLTGAVYPLSQRTIFSLYTVAAFELIFSIVTFFKCSVKRGKFKKVVLQYSFVLVSAILGGVFPSFLTKDPSHILLWTSLTLIALGVMNPFYLKLDS